MALILVADDDLDICRLVEQRLIRAGHQTLVAHDGDRAYRLAETSGADLLLLDVSMPGMDGYTICRTLAERHADPPPVIFLTARGLPDERVRGFEVGAVDYVVKPFSSSELLARVAAALRTKARIDRLAEAAVVDRLTGVGTRTALDERLAHAFAQGRRGGQQLSCAMLDIDYFKRVNDVYGHAGGDAVLREVGARLKAAARASDEVFRYGGDEFLILFAGGRPDQLTAAVEAIVSSVGERPVTLGLEDGAPAIAVRVSAGVASLRPDHADAGALLRDADEALYRAKRSGRSRVVVAGIATAA